MPIGLPPDANGSDDGGTRQSAPLEQPQQDGSVDEEDVVASEDDFDDPAGARYVTAGFSTPEDFSTCRAAGFTSKAAYDACISLGFPQGLRDLELRESELGQALLKEQRQAEARLSALEDRNEVQRVDLRSAGADLEAFRATASAQVELLQRGAEGLPALEKKVARLRKEIVRLSELQARVDAPNGSYTPDQRQLDMLDNMPELAADLRMAEDALEGGIASRGEVVAAAEAMDSGLEGRRSVVSRAEADAQRLADDISAVKAAIGSLEGSRVQLASEDELKAADCDELEQLRRRVARLRAVEKILQSHQRRQEAGVH